MVKLNNDGFSTALMIDQRVSENQIEFTNAKAFTTTIPAQLVKNIKYQLFNFEKFDDINFKVTAINR